MWASRLLLFWQLQLELGTESVFCFVFLSVMLPSEIIKLPQTCLWEVFLLCGNFSFMTPSPGWVSIPQCFVSVFIFYVLSYLLSKRLGCLSGCLVFSASIQKLFCGSWPAFKWSFDEFAGETVVSPSYSSTIFRRWKLTPHTSLSCYSVYCAYWLVAKKNSMKTVEKQNDFTVE